MESSKGSGADALAVDAATSNLESAAAWSGARARLHFPPTSNSNLRITARIKMCVSLTPCAARGIPGNTGHAGKRLQMKRGIWYRGVGKNPEGMFSNLKYERSSFY